MTQLHLAVRNVFRHRLRSVVSLTTVAFGAVALIFINGFFRATLKQMREAYINNLTSHIQISVKLDLSKRVEGEQRLLPNPIELLDLVQHIDGVAWATCRLGFPAVLSNGQASIPCFIQGVEPSHTHYHHRKDLANRHTLQIPAAGVMMEGANLEQEHPYSILLGQGLARALNAKPGDSLTVMAGTVHGSLNANELNVNGIFMTSSKAHDDRSARIPLTLAQDLYRTESVETVLVYLKHTEDTKRVQKIIRDELSNRGYSYDVKNWFEVNDFYAKTERLFLGIFTILKIVIGIVVVILIYNIINMTVLERTAEVGTLAAMGARRSDIRRLFVLEGACIGFFGAVFGLFFGAAITLLAGHYGIEMPPPPGGEFVWWVEPKLTFGGLFFAGWFCVITTVLASLLPAHVASRLEIAAALRRQS